MTRAGLAVLAAAFSACQSTPRLEGNLDTAADLKALAQAGDPRGTAAIALRGHPLVFLSDPYQAGAAAVQAPQNDGLVVQPAFSDAHAAAFVTTERWEEFPKVWAQPVYVLVTGFDSLGNPRTLPGSFPIFGVGPGSRFYCPFWQTQYTLVPAGTKGDAIRSAEDIIARNYPLTPGPLVLWSIVPRDLGVAAPDGFLPAHPFTDDELIPRLPSQGWLDRNLVFFLDFGANRFRMSDTNVVTEVALFHLALRSADGTPQPLPVPPIIGTGPFRGAKAADAPNGIPQFGALQHAYTAVIGPGVGGTIPGIFVSADRPALRQALIAQLGEQYFPQPSDSAERLPEREQYTLRVALDGTCFFDTNFPDTCTWLDSQTQIEGNLPPAVFTDEKVFTAGSFLFFDGVAL
jgi:hypothetical protein